MSFRKTDIDAYDEDVLLESELYEPDPRDPAQALNDAKQKQVVVRSALAKYSHIYPTLALLIRTGETFQEPWTLPWTARLMGHMLKRPRCVRSRVPSHIR